MNKPLFTVNDYELFHNTNLYVPSRTVYFGGQPYDEDVVTSQTVATLIKNLHILEHREIAPISILLNTVGGSWEAGIAVYDIIQSLQSEITIVGMGQVYSMGSVIIQAADKRVLTPNTYMMIHDGTEYYEGDPKKIERWLEVSKAVLLKMYDIYWQKMKKKNKKIKFSEVEKLCAIDTIYNAEEAVKLGLADEIMGTLK
jgi:ATP-dependent Clp protease, protease subunit